TFELELNCERAVLVVGTPAHVAAADDAQPPAAGVVLPADELLERLLLEQRVGVAADDAPALGHGPDDRHVALLERAAPVTVAEAEETVVLRTVLEARLHARRLVRRVVPLV